MEVEFQATGASRRLTLSTCTLDIETTPNNILLTVIGELDMGDADRVGDVLTEAAHAGKPIVRVNLAGLTFADSSAIRALLPVPKQPTIRALPTRSSIHTAACADCWA